MKNLLASTIMMKTVLASSIAALLLTACMESPDDDFRRRNNGNGDDPNGEGPNGPGDPTQPGTCKEGVAHNGFGDQNFVADRTVGAIGADRRRIKPYSALRTEFQRVLGTVPASLGVNQAAYGTDSPRWFGEPTAGAVSLYTTYSVAFSACYDTMTDAKYGTAPTDATARAECSTLQRKSWQRTPSTEEITACAELAVSGLTDEPIARRRWAHACASVLTSAGFTSY